MPRLFRASTALLLLVLSARLAAAQGALPWDGLYLGANLGDLTSSACRTSTLVAGAIGSTSDTTFSNCSTGGIAAGMQIGENFQFRRLVLGVGADVVLSGAKQSNSAFKLTGPTPPPGTYSLSGKLVPKDFAIIGTRIGYAGDLFLPYIKGGLVIASGAQNSDVSFTPPGGTKSIAAFSAGKSFNSAGWAAGGGTEIGFNGPWSLSVEYLHISLGRNSSSTRPCAGSADACAAFTDISLESTHKSYIANTFRLGINYWFNYWDGP